MGNDDRSGIGYRSLGSHLWLYPLERRQWVSMPGAALKALLYTRFTTWLRVEIFLFMFICAWSPEVILMCCHNGVGQSFGAISGRLAPVL